MRFHLHIWKYYSSKHRLCRICGEPQTLEDGVFSKRWRRTDFDEWLKSYPEQKTLDRKEAYEERAREVKNKRIEESWAEDRRKGKAYLKKGEA